MTNREFSETDNIFKTACEDVGLPNHKVVVHKRDSTSTKSGSSSLVRQASKWRNGKGLAYKTKNNISFD